MKVAHVAAAWTHIYKLALRMVSSDEVFFNVHNWAVNNPPPAIPNFDHHFQIDIPLPDINMDGIDFQAPPPGFAVQ